MTKQPSIPILEILYINHFECQCGAEYSVPNPKLMYLYEAKHTWTKNGVRVRSITTTKGKSFAGLPREIRHTPATSLEACPYCFSPKHVGKQQVLDFFPSEPTDTAITPTPLSEF